MTRRALPTLVLGDGTTIAEARARLADSGVPGAPVVDQGGAYRGIVSAGRLATAADDALLRELAESGPTVAADDGLDDALGTMVDRRADWAPVLAGGRLVGVISVRDVMRAYRDALAGNVRQVRGLGAGGILLEADLRGDSPIVGRAVADTPWPADVVLVAIDREGSLIVPTGSVVLQAGDHISMFTKPASEPEARALLGARLDPSAGGSATVG